MRHVKRMLTSVHAIVKRRSQEKLSWIETRSNVAPRIMLVGNLLEDPTFSRRFTFIHFESYTTSVPKYWCHLEYGAASGSKWHQYLGEKIEKRLFRVGAKWQMESDGTSILEQSGGAPLPGCGSRHNLRVVSAGSTGRTGESTPGVNIFVLHPKSMSEQVTAQNSRIFANCP